MNLFQSHDVSTEMPLSQQQFQALFVGAPKAYGDYEKKFGNFKKLYQMYTTVGPVAFPPLVTAFYPDQLKSVHTGLTTGEKRTLAAMNAATLTSLRAVSAHWIKDQLRIIANTDPPAGAQIAPGAVSLTATHAAHANTVVTEVTPVANTSPRNLIFDAAGRAVAEINFGNHGGTATSGHAHVYPVKSMPITGHHVSGTTHFGNGDYPDGWRALPVGIAPARALWT